MHIGVVGINHKVADLELREEVAAQGQTLRERRTILLSTCNRTEIYFSTHELAEKQQELLDHLGGGQAFYTFFGADAFHHLSRVTAGLDSALLFETEIQGQVKRAYEGRIGDLPSDLHYAFQKALRMGKQLRSEFPTRAASLEKAVRRETRWSGKRVLLVGASQTNWRMAQTLEDADLTLCNRSPNEFPLPQLPWSELERWREFDVVICATTAPHILLSGDPGRVELLIDLSLPRNIDPKLGDRVRLRNIQQLQGSVQGGPCPVLVASAEERLLQLLERHLSRPQPSVSAA